MFTRIGNHPQPRIILSGELYAGHRDRGTPKKGFKHCLKKSFSAWDIDNHQWFTQAKNHYARSLNTDNVFFKYPAFKDKRHRRRNRNTVPSGPDQNFSCGRCDCGCQLHISLTIYESACICRGPKRFWSSFYKAKLWWRSNSKKDWTL